LERIAFKGLVFCPTVSTGLFVARRCGKIFITGNSGFPKATRPDTQLDAAAGEEVAHGKEFNMKGKAGNDRADKFEENGRTQVRHEPKTELAKAWAGHRYGLQAMKPAVEPIIVFQKPYAGKPIESMALTGAGALNIEAARIPIDPSVDDPRLGGKGTWSTGKMAKNVYEGGYAGSEVASSENGRWPSNFICSDETAPKLDGQSGLSASRKGKPRGTSKKGMFSNSKFNKVGSEYDDKGGASRFFLNVETTLDAADPIFYCSKASTSEKEAGLDAIEEKAFGFSGGANGKLAEGKEDYEEGQGIGLNRIRRVRNTHPTVKPLKLCEHLATLLLPPSAYAPRRILVPFSGSGSEMIGCGRAGWDEVVGVELTPEYVGIADLRVRHYFPGSETEIVPVAQAPVTLPEAASPEPPPSESAPARTETDDERYDRLTEEELDGRKLDANELQFMKDYSARRKA